MKGLIVLWTEATIGCRRVQIDAGAEVVKIFDRWPGSLEGDDFTRFQIEPLRRITAALKAAHSDVPVIVFPRGAGERYASLHAVIGADCIALDDGISAKRAADHVQNGGCVQRNLASSHTVSGGDALVYETCHIVDTLSGGPHTFNLGHGIVPDADPENVQLMIDTVRASKGQAKMR